MTADVLREAAALMRDEWSDADLGIKPTAFYLAVADWLDAEASASDALSLMSDLAEEMKTVDVRGAALTVSRESNGTIRLRADTSKPALAVARAYLPATT